MSIIVSGATGQLGSAVVNAFLDAGFEVSAAVRNPEKDRSNISAKARIVAFDFDKPDTFKPALEGIKQIYLIAAVKDPEKVFEFLDVAEKSKELELLIFSSGRTTGDIPGKPLNDIENYIQKSKLPWIIVRPGWFMQNFASWIGNDIRKEQKIYLPAADAKTTFVDVRDLARAATILVNDNPPKLEKIHEWTGQEALSHKEVASLLSQALDRKIEYIPLSETAFAERLIKQGSSKDAAEATNFLYRIVRSGKEAESDPGLAKTLGRPTIRMEAFIQDYLDHWQPS
ncbi:MAG: NmrA family NAD(P)-binding protein [Bacteroidetes bacterium]|nr:NmrA family NAD(P)-binding protein [Bacteroidota bacterium]